uniref:Uncharacterized protein n=1 Tax=Zea mays TaxID=4577 RepID=A0A804P4W0_MAIZE
MMRPLRCGHGAWTIFFFGGRSDAMRACGPGASSVATWVGVGWPALQAPATRPRQAIRRGRGHRLQTSVQRRAATSARLAVADAGQVAAAEVDPVPAHAPLASGNQDRRRNLISVVNINRDYYNRSPPPPVTINLAATLLGAAVPACPELGHRSDLKCSTGVTGHDAHRSLSLADYGRLELDC